MRDTRRMVIWGIGGLVVALVLAFGCWRFLSVAQNPYAGLTLVRETNIPEETRLLLEQRIATTKASITAKESAGETVAAELYESIAYDSYVLGDLRAARENYERVLNDNPLYYVAWNSYANVLDAMGDYEHAEQAYLQSLTLANDVEDYYMDFAKFLLTRFTDRDEEARTVLEQGVTVLGQRQSFMVALAEWYVAHGDCDRAVAHYNVVARLNPAAAESVDAKIAAARIACQETTSGE